MQGAGCNWACVSRAPAVMRETALFLARADNIVATTLVVVVVTYVRSDMNLRREKEEERELCYPLQRNDIVVSLLVWSLQTLFLR